MSNKSTTFSTASPGLLLRLARFIWLGLALMLLGLWLINIPTFVGEVTQAPSTSVPAPSSFDQHAYQDKSEALGISLRGYAWINLLVNALGTSTIYIVSGLILWRLKTSWYGWFTAMILLLGGSIAMGDVLTSASDIPLISFLNHALVLVWPFFMLWVYLFPNGKAVPKRLKVLVTILFSIFFGQFFIEEFLAASITTPFLEEFIASPLVGLALLVLILIAQIYRYIRLSDPIERQQVKWFLFAVVLQPCALVFSGSVFYSEILTLVFIFIPISIGFAILKYRLWDIDVIIRRTLVYGSPTALLALVYFGIVVLLQKIFGLMSGSENSPIAIVVSTLAIAALFTPLRNRIQTFIDRRFYRTKYNAEQALASFAHAARRRPIFLCLPIISSNWLMAPSIQYLSICG